MTGGLTHFDTDGASRMVDVSAKEVTHRVATAIGQVTMKPETMRMIRDRSLSKGDVIEVARLAGIMAAKRTADLIPLCHPLPLTSVTISIQPVSDTILEITCNCKVDGKTGVEMEALTAVSVSCLTVYDMAKAIDRDMTIGPIQLEAKSGGKSGCYRRADNE